MKQKKEPLFINEHTLASLKEAARYLFLVNGTACNIFIALDVLQYKISIFIFASGLSFDVIFFLLFALNVDSTRENIIANGVNIFYLGSISCLLFTSLLCFISGIIYTIIFV